MKIVIISPWSRNAPNGQICAKNYPFWSDIVRLLRENKEIHTIQVGVEGEKDIGADSKRLNLPMKDLRELLNSCATWISVDNFFHHFAHYYGKPGVVLFGKSDPRIFGYPENKNLYKDKKYFRNNQYLWWNDEPLDEKSFPWPDEVINNIKSFV